MGITQILEGGCGPTVFSVSTSPHGTISITRTCLDMVRLRVWPRVDNILLKDYRWEHRPVSWWWNLGGNKKPDISNSAGDHPAALLLPDQPSPQEIIFYHLKFQLTHIFQIFHSQENAQGIHEFGGVFKLFEKEKWRTGKIENLITTPPEWAEWQKSCPEKWYTTYCQGPLGVPKNVFGQVWELNIQEIITFN